MFKKGLTCCRLQSFGKLSSTFSNRVEITQWNVFIEQCSRNYHASPNGFAIDVHKRRMNAMKLKKDFESYKRLKDENPDAELEDVNELIDEKEIDRPKLQFHPDSGVSSQPLRSKKMSSYAHFQRKRANKDLNKDEMNDWYRMVKERSRKRKFDPHQASGMPRLANIGPKALFQLHRVEIPEFKQPNNPRILKIAIVGNPNVGKSTFLNSFLNTKVAAVSSKLCTTRDNTRAIFTKGNCQVLFFDTPGILDMQGVEEEIYVNRDLIEDAMKTLEEVDGVFLMIDGSRDLSLNMHILQKLVFYEKSNPGKLSLGIMAVLNKQDQTYPRSLFQSRLKELQDHPNISRVFPVSATKHQGFENIEEYLKRKARAGQWIYPPNWVVPYSQEDMCREIIREKLFTSLHEEIPYSLDVVLEKLPMSLLKRRLPENEAKELYGKKILFFKDQKTKDHCAELRAIVYCPKVKLIEILRKKLKRIQPKATKSLQRYILNGRKVILHFLVKLYPEVKKRKALDQGVLKRRRPRKIIKRN